MNLTELVEKLSESIAALDAGFEPEYESLKELVEQTKAAIEPLDAETIAELMVEDDSIETVVGQILDMEETVVELFTKLDTERQQAEAAKVERQASILARLAEKTGKKVDTTGVEDEATSEKAGDVSKGSSKIDASKLAATINNARAPKPESVSAPTDSSNHKIYSDSNYVDTLSGTRVLSTESISWDQVASAVKGSGNTGKSIAKVVFESSKYDYVDDGSGSKDDFHAAVLSKLDERAAGVEVMSASSICARETDFSVRNISSGCSKFASSLTTIRGTRPLEFFQSVYGNFTDPANVGGFEWTDADYMDPKAEKPCLPSSCNYKLGCEPRSIGWCFEVDRYQEMSHPEQVAALKQLLDVYFQYRVENYALSSYMSTLAALPFTDAGVTFGANIDFAQKIGLLIAQLSASIQYSGDWDVWLPSQAYHKLAGDRLASPLRELGNLESAINADGTAGARIRLGEYCGTAASATVPAIPGGSPLTSVAFGAQALPTVTAGPPVTVTPGTGGVIPTYPLVNRVLIAPAGAGVRNILGDISIETRETIVKNNRKKLFYEQDSQICWRNLHWAFDMSLCDSGATGAFADKVCA